MKKLVLVSVALLASSLNVQSFYVMEATTLTQAVKQRDAAAIVRIVNKLDVTAISLGTDREVLKEARMLLEKEVQNVDPIRGSTFMKAITKLQQAGA